VVPMHLSLIDGPFVPHNLISTQESPTPLPKFQMAPRLKILMSSGPKKGTQIYFSLKKSWQANPLQVPQQDPCGERYQHTGHFYISLNISPFVFPSESPGREPPPCPITGSPWTGILRHQSHWFIYSFMYVCRSPKKGALLYMGKNIRSSSMEPHADRRPTYSGVQPGSPRGSLMTLLSLPQCHAALSMIPSTLA